MLRQEYVLRLALSWINQSYRRDLAPVRAPAQATEIWTATDPDHGSLTVCTADLFEAPEAWEARSAELSARLDDARPGSYLLWVPPGGELPGGEPAESEWVRRVVLAASKLASGRIGEARFPVKMSLGKLRDEGGHASVSGGLGRHWTKISDRLNGSYFLESGNLKRLTPNQEERDSLFENIGVLAQGVAISEVAEFEHDDSWTVQRLPRNAATEGVGDGWAIAGCPAGFEPEDGGAIRRLLRQRLSKAREALSEMPRPWLLVLSGAYDYMANENVGPSLRGFDPSLSAALDGIILVADGEVKPLMLGPTLPFRDAAEITGG